MPAGRAGAVQVEYYEQAGSCEQAQLKLEQMACEVHERSLARSPAVDVWEGGGIFCIGCPVFFPQQLQALGSQPR